MFSSRLPRRATAGLNRLAAAEQARRAAGQQVLDLTASNPTAVGLGVSAETLADALASALADPTAARYEPAPLGPPAARAAVAREYARLGAMVDPAHIVLSASSSESYAWLFKLLGNPGDVVLVPEPSYPLFGYLAGLEAVALRPYPLRFAGGEWHLDWSALDLEGARAIIVVNPNNPTGSFLRRDEWERLARLAGERDIAVIVDEVFADYPLAPPPDALRTVVAASLACADFCPGRAVQVLRPAPDEARLDVRARSGDTGGRGAVAPGADRRHVSVGGDAGAGGAAAAADHRHRRACRHPRARSRQPGSPGRGRAWIQRHPAADRGRLVGHRPRPRHPQRRGLGAGAAGRRRCPGPARLLLRPRGCRRDAGDQLDHAAGDLRTESGACCGGWPDRTSLTLTLSRGRGEGKQGGPGTRYGSSESAVGGFEEGLRSRWSVCPLPAAGRG